MSPIGKLLGALIHALAGSFNILLSDALADANFSIPSMGSPSGRNSGMRGRFSNASAKPEYLIGDYDSDLLDVELRKEGVEMISPHCSNCKRQATQDGRRLRRYERRWLVERFSAWLYWQRRRLTRFEYYAQNFLGFLSTLLSSLCC
jgi:hypothetical protein